MKRDRTRYRARSFASILYHSSSPALRFKVTDFLRMMLGFLLVCLLFAFFEIVSSQSVSITDGSAFSSLRSCARSCIGSTQSGPLFLASELSCPSPYDNSCFCRSDLQQKADSYLSSCINRVCSNTLDANSGASIYDAYCTSAGHVVVAATTGTQSTLTTSLVYIALLPQCQLSHLLTNT